MELLSVRIVKNMIRYGVIDKSLYDDYLYSVQVFIEKLVSLISIFGLALIFHCFFEVLLFYLSFSFLRKTSGGFHFDGFAKCYISSICISLGGVLVYPLASILSVVCQGGVLMATIFIILIGAVNHPNIRWSDKEFKAAKLITRVKVLSLVIVIIALDLFEIGKRFLYSMGLGIVLCAITILVEVLREKGGERYEGLNN